MNGTIDPRLLALFGSESWQSELEKVTACEAARACEDIVGGASSAAWFERSKPCYWFLMADTDLLIQVTGVAKDWTVLALRPRIVSRQVHEAGERGQPSHSVSVTLKTDPITNEQLWKGSDHSAGALLAFYRKTVKQLLWKKLD